jgi:carbonic anhydrase/acetyltransferase-like protein (isoleucine patch superfamily)
MENPEQLADLLRALYQRNDEALRARFKRSLSFEDGLFDRWERARRLGFGAGASIYNSALVYGDVTVGRETWIGPWTILDGSAAPLVIGDYCSISAGVHLYTHDTVRWALSGGAAPKRTGPVRVGDCVYIGPQSIVALGVDIGRQCLICSNSFVNRSLAPRSVAAGNPARAIGTVTGEGAAVAVQFDRDPPAGAAAREEPRYD